MPGGFGEEGYDAPGSRYEFQGRVNPADPSVANGQITPEQWARYQASRRRAAILGTLGTVGGMLFAQPAINALGFGSGAGAAAGSASLPAAATEGMLPMSVAAGPGAGAVGAGAGAAGAAGKGLFSGLTARDLAAIGLTIPSVISGMQGMDNSPTTATNDPNLQALLRTMQGRLDKSEPLYDSVLAMANGLLPTQYQKGGGGMR